jgi:hypothetical protein
MLGFQKTYQGNLRAPCSVGTFLCLGCVSVSILVIILCNFKNKGAG